MTIPWEQSPPGLLFLTLTFDGILLPCTLLTPNRIHTPSLSPSSRHPKIQTDRTKRTLEIFQSMPFILPIRIGSPACLCTGTHLAISALGATTSSLPRDFVLSGSHSGNYNFASQLYFPICIHMCSMSPTFKTTFFLLLVSISSLTVQFPKGTSSLFSYHLPSLNFTVQCG